MKSKHQLWVAALSICVCTACVTGQPETRTMSYKTVTVKQESRTLGATYSATIRGTAQNELLRAEAAVEQAEAQRINAENSLSYTVVKSPSDGVIGTLPYRQGAAGWTNSNGGGILNPGSWLLNAFGSLTQPLFNRGRNIANLKIAQAQQEEDLFEFQQSILNAGKEVNDALIQWQTAKQRIKIGDKQISALQKAVRKTELLMHHSSVNYLEVLTAQQSLLTAEQTQVQNRFDEIQGIINLYHALGGGQ